MTINFQLYTFNCPFGKRNNEQKNKLNQHVFTDALVKKAVEYKSDPESLKLVKDYRPWFEHIQVRDDGRVYLNDKEIITLEKADTLLHELFYNARTGFAGRDKFYSIIAQKYVGISLSKVRSWLKAQRVWQLRQPTFKKKVTRPIVSKNVNNIWQCDLVSMQKYSDYNTGYSYILNVVDIFSKYLFSFPLVTKTAEEVAERFTSLFAVRKPKYLQSDRGAEFRNAQMTSVCKKFDVKQIFSKSYSPTTNSGVERTNGSIKTLISQSFLHNGDRVWAEHLPAFVANYNNRIHRITGETPSVVQNSVDQKLLAKVANNIQHHAMKMTNYTAREDLKVGDDCRIAKRAIDPKAKGNKFYKPLQRWSSEIYKIIRVLKFNECLGPHDISSQ